MTYISHLEATDVVVPTIMDDDLWTYVNNDLVEHYGGRFSVDDRRRSFEKTCNEHDDIVSVDRFTKRCRMNCIWVFRHDLRNPEEIAEALMKEAADEARKAKMSA